MYRVRYIKKKKNNNNYGGDEKKMENRGVKVNSRVERKKKGLAGSTLRLGPYGTQHGSRQVQKPTDSRNARKPKIDLRQRFFFFL